MRIIQQRTVPSCTTGQRVRRTNSLSWFGEALHPFKHQGNSWLKKQKDRDDPVGDLASDVLRDANLDAVRNSNAPATWRSHLRQKGAPSQAIEVLERAFAEWTLTR